MANEEVFADNCFKSIGPYRPSG